MNKITFIRSFVCNTKRPSVKQSIKCQVSSNLADEPTLAVLPPHLKLPDEKVTATRFHTINENPFETVNLLENIREIPVYIRIQIPKADGPPSQLKLAEL